MGGGGAGKGRAKPQRKKGKSGNPAKRAEQERLAAQREAEARENAFGGAFGLPGGQDADPDLSSLSLPKGFEKYLDGKGQP